MNWPHVPDPSSDWWVYHRLFDYVTGSNQDAANFLVSIGIIACTGFIASIVALIMEVSK